MKLVQTQERLLKRWYPVWDLRQLNQLTFQLRLRSNCALSTEWNRPRDHLYYYYYYRVHTVDVFVLHLKIWSCPMTIWQDGHYFIFYRWVPTYTTQLFKCLLHLEDAIWDVRIILITSIETLDERCIKLEAISNLVTAAKEDSSVVIEEHGKVIWGQQI